MIQFKSGILDTTRIVSNILMLILVAGNIFFSIQYTQNILTQQNKVDKESAKDTERILDARLMRSFVNIVLNTKGAISLEDRVKLENDVRQTHDADIIKLWETFVASKDGKSAQTAAVNLMVVLGNKML
jgi:hypothetical protein